MQKVLIIEDEEIVLEPLCDLLEHEKFEVLSAMTGEDGLAKAILSLPDIIICDIMLPGMDGYGVLDELRKNHRTANIPVIFLTARVERADVRKGMEHGADDYLCKPVMRKELLAAIRAQISKRKSNQFLFNQRLESLSTEIAAAISHEMLTPLNGIIGFSQLMSFREPGDSAADSEDMAKSILESAQRLHQTVRHFLDYVSLRALTDQPNLAGALLGTGTDDAATIVEFAAVKVASEFKRPGDLHLQLEKTAIGIPPSFLDLVTVELTENAFKFSKPGSPVHVQLSRTADGVTLTAIDKGRGMDAKTIKQMGAFRQFDRTKYEQQGLGLGLEIVRLIAEIFGAQLTFDSRVDLGTRVQFSKNHSESAP